MCDVPDVKGERVELRRRVAAVQRTRDARAADALRARCDATHFCAVWRVRSHRDADAPVSEEERQASRAALLTSAPPVVTECMGRSDYGKY